VTGQDKRTFEVSNCAGCQVAKTDVLQWHASLERLRAVEGVVVGMILSTRSETVADQMPSKLILGAGGSRCES
jgi:hypothetical protein